jgi:hypothetical protein
MKKADLKLMEGLNADGRVIGIGTDLNPYGGYDECLYYAWNEPPDDLQGDDLTEWKAAQIPDEGRCRLADYMIGLWSQYRHAIEGAEPLWDVGYESMQHQIEAQKLQLQNQADSYRARVKELQEALMRAPKMIEVLDDETDAYWRAVSDSVASISSAMAACPEGAINARRPLKDALANLVVVLQRRAVPPATQEEEGI